MTTLQAVKGKAQIKEALIKNTPSMITQPIVSKQSILDILKELASLSESLQDKERFYFLEREISEITKIPYERHKLSSADILKICMVANEHLQEASKTKETKYLRADLTGLARALVIDGKRGSFTILSKRYGKLFASGTFKKVTDAIDVTTTNAITAKRVVRLVNKGGKPFYEKELMLHERFGMILTRVDYLAKNWQDEIKTTLIEEAYDHDMHFFTNNDKYPKKNRINTQELVSLLCQTIEQIAIMHQEGYAHQDIKTKNILFRREPDGRVTAKLTDFGHVAKIVSSALTKKERDHHYGTVRYGSPELLAISNQLDFLLAQRQAEDMYALGCVIYELLFFKPIPWAKEYYQGAKESQEHEVRTKALAKQHETYESLRNMYAMSQKTDFEMLGYITTRLLDPDPKTRMTVNELLPMIKSMENVH
jgi:serine/threonine protein kinase